MMRARKKEAHKEAREEQPACAWEMKLKAQLVVAFISDLWRESSHIRMTEEFVIAPGVAKFFICFD